MNAVSSPVSSESLNKSVTNLPPGHIMRTLSTSLCVPYRLVFPLPPCQILTRMYVIPLNCVQGLMYMDIRPFTDDEAKTLPRIIFTRDIPWDPTRYDSTSLNDRMDARDAYTFADKVDNKQYIKYRLDMEKEDPEFTDTLKDEICKRGAMDALASERAQDNMGYAHTGMNVSEEEESDYESDYEYEYEYTYTYTHKEDKNDNGINDRRTDGW